MQILQWLFIISGGILQLLVISALLRGPYRAFPLLFAYAVSLGLATVVEVAAILDIAGWSLQTSKYYWINEVILQTLVFLLVLSLIHRAMQDSPKKGSTLRWLTLGALAVVALSLVAGWGTPMNRWMTLMTRNLSFSAVLLNFTLWLMLLKARLPDPRVLMISGGLGIQMAGQAIAYSLRELAIPHRSMPLIIASNLVLSVAHLTCLFVWWQALRHRQAVAARRTSSAL